MYDTYWPINPFNEAPSRVPILREVFPEWKLNKGIFDRLAELYEVPWGDSAESSVLNYEYFGNRSGGKLVAPIVLNMLGENDSLDDIDRDILASIIWTKFKEPWKHLWLTNDVTYNPIHNYDMKEKRELAKGESESRVVKDGSVDTTDHGRGSEDTEYVYGLNSDSAGKHSNRTVSQENGETVVTGDRDMKDDSVKAGNEVETTERAGNIGVTTTQAMLSAEREAWKWNFFDQVYRDIDAVLSLPIYDPCRI